MLRQSSFLRTFLATDNCWNDAAEAKWANASRLKRASHFMPRFIPIYERSRRRAQFGSKPAKFRCYAFFECWAKFSPVLMVNSG
jgi:hypothetical protein